MPASRLPRAGLTALLVCLAIEIAVVALRPRFAGALDYTVQAKLAAMTDSASIDDVVIFGDSRFFAIEPAAVERALGGNLTVTNYSWPFAGVEMVEFALDAYLRAKQPPRLILVGWMPENLAVSADRLTAAADPLYQTRLFNALPAGPLAWSLARGGHGELFWGFVEHRLMPPSAHHRDRLTDWVLGNNVTSEDDQRLFESFRRSGSFLLYNRETAPPDAVRSYERASGGFAPESAAPNAAPFRRFLERASSEAIPVLLLNVPLPNRLHERFQEVGVIERYRLFIGEMAASFDNFRVVEPLIEVYPDEYFADVGHLNDPGDRAYQQAYPARLTQYASAAIQVSQPPKLR